MTGPAVRVFRNLGPKYRAGPPVYSLQVREPGQGWRTVAHARHVALVGAEFRVSAAGVARIRATGVKTVVAAVHGRLASWSGCAVQDCRDLAWRCSPAEAGPDGWARVRFNPKSTDTFVDAAGAPLMSAPAAFLGEMGVLARLSP